MNVIQKIIELLLTFTLINLDTYIGLLQLLLSFHRYTSKPGLTYAIALEWPKDETLYLGSPVPAENATVNLLGLPGVEFPWKPLSEKGGMKIIIPPLSASDLPCQWAWVFKMTNVK